LLELALLCVSGAGEGGGVGAGSTTRVDLASGIFVKFVKETSPVMVYVVPLSSFVCCVKFFDEESEALNPDPL
ncbi:hypothetical protein CP8484711_0432B, partial [Chlamydia psittaci 84-8471/1]